MRVAFSEGGVIADTVNVTQQAEPATEPAANSAEMDGTLQHSFAAASLG